MREFKQLFNQTTVHQRHSTDRFLGKGIAPSFPSGISTLWIFKQALEATEAKKKLYFSSQENDAATTDVKNASNTT